MSRRVERLESLIKRILAEEITYRMADPRIEPMTSITRVKLSADISSAVIYVSVLADDGRRRSCVRALNGAAGKLRRLLASEMHIRQVPELRFELDDSIQRGSETLNIIDEAMRELNDRRPDASVNADGSASDENSEPNDTQEKG
ncbi:MAG: 30S ribosome-binding factor RbfA [Phycisphaerae bacterium]